MNINIITLPNKWSIIINGELHQEIEGTRPSELFTKAGQVIDEYLYWHTVSTDCVVITMNGVITCDVTTVVIS